MIKQLLNPQALAALFRRQFELCQVKKGEAVALLTDIGTRREYVLAAFAAAAELDAKAYELGIGAVRDWSRLGNDALGSTKGIMESLKASDLVCAFFAPNFSKWQREVRAAGGRVLSIGDSPDNLASLISPPGLKEAVVYAIKRWNDAREIRLLDEAGTDLTWTHGEYKARGQYGFAEERGRYDKWGGGHVLNHPNEGSANGAVVLKPGDLWILPYVRAIENPVRIEVRDGFIRKVEGGLDAKAFRYTLDRNKRSEDDLDPYALSHLGFGLHPNARWDQILLYGNDPEQLRAHARTFSGNFLFSTGPNTEAGGTRDTKGHIDAPMCDCTLLLDNEVVLDRGRFVDERMIVPGTQ